LMIGGRERRMGRRLLGTIRPKLHSLSSPTLSSSLADAVFMPCIAGRRACS
jgi:hypothetical protein